MKRWKRPQIAFKQEYANASINQDVDKIIYSDTNRVTVYNQS